MTDSVDPIDPAASPSTFTVLDVSTAHVHPKDLELLRSAPVAAQPTDSGAWVAVPDHSELADTLGDLAAYGMSELLCNVLRRAVEHGCAFVYLDADGPPDNALASSALWGS